MKIGSIDSTHLYFRSGKQGYRLALPLSPIDLRSLVETALYAGIEALWVLPGSLAHTSAKLAPGKFTCHEHYEVRKSTDRKGVPLSLLAWRKRGTREERRAIMLFWPGHDARWGLEEIEEPGRLLSALNALQEALEIDLKWSPGHVARDLMIKANEGKREMWVRAPNMLPEIMSDAHYMAKDLREKIPSEVWGPCWGAPERELYLHIFDKNSMYLGACTGVNLGEGQPTLQKNINFNAKLPGLWHILMDENQDQWVWTPELEYMLREKDYPIIEAWVWPIYHQTLRSWAETLWAARQSLKERNADAYGAIKNIATQGLGWLAHKPTKGDGMQWYRPDWWSMIVSAARAKMLYKIRQLEQTYGHPPIWCNVDEIGVISTVADASEAFPAMLTHPDGLGGFKLKSSILITDEVVQLFSSETPFRECEKRLLELGGKR